MTNQELFDVVIAHARSQNARAIENEVCSYRTVEGLKCFAGALIKDEFYRPDLERYGAQFSNVQHVLKQSGISPEQLGLVYKLQRIHDRHLVPEWPREFRVLAEMEGLAYEDDPA